MNDKQLMELAIKAKTATYSPYSKFPVGAAVEIAGGKFFCGTNVENASSGHTMCAERVAIFTAIAQNDSKPKLLRIAVSCGSEPAKLSLQERVPCGGCLQVMSEFCDDDLKILVDAGSEYSEFRFSDILKIAFRLGTD